MLMSAEVAREKVLSLHTARDIEGSLAKHIDEAVAARKTSVSIGDEFFWTEKDITEEVLASKGYGFGWDYEDKMLHVYWGSKHKFF